MKTLNYELLQQTFDYDTDYDFDLSIDGYTKENKEFIKICLFGFNLKKTDNQNQFADYLIYLKDKGALSVLISRKRKKKTLNISDLFT